MPQLNVYALPSYTTPEEMAGGTVVVIDVLRASTTIVHALEAGAREVIPCLEVEDALDAAAGFPPGEAVLAGERGGLLIEGFDLGNSPTEFTPESVGGRSVVFTTTNGTRAMQQCRLAEKVFIGAFVNASAVVSRLVGQDRIHLLCSGTRGEFGRDDILLAGLLVAWLERRGGPSFELNAQAVTARENWTTSFALPYAIGAEPLPAEMLAAELRKTPGGRNLVAVGLEDDILTAAHIDRFEIVPDLDVREFRIRD